MLDDVRRGGDHLGDDVAGAQHDHVLASADVLAPQVLLVVERGELDRDAPDGNGRKHRVGTQVAGLADVPADALQAGHGRGRGELPRYSPPRLAPDGAETALGGQVGDLDDDAVDLEVELAPTGLPGKALGDHVLLGAQALDVAVDAEAVGAQPLKRLPVGREREPLGDPHLVAPDRQRSFGGQSGVELADGAGGRVARVHERREALLGAALVERGEVPQRHVQLAANLQQRGRALDVQRDRTDRAEVVGDVLPDLPVPARGAALEHPVAVDQADGEPVDLGLDDVGEARLGDALARQVTDERKLLDFLELKQLSFNFAEEFDFLSDVPDFPQKLRAAYQSG